MKLVYKIMFVVSVSLAVLSIVALSFYGLNFSVDFKGGSVSELIFSKSRPSTEAVQKLLQATDFSDAGVSVVGDKGLIIRTKELTEKQHQELLVKIGTAYPESGMEESKFDSVGPVVGGELKTKSVRAIGILLIAIIIYIAIVFRKLGRTLNPWTMGLAAVVALVHDIIIPMGIFSVLGHYSGVEISAVFVAAALTILGFSVSDTVVVFDRVRENVLRGAMAKDSFAQVVHVSIMQTLVRSINTTLTVLLSLAAIYFFGGESIKYFSLALILGFSFGAYSSIFIASPLLVWLTKGPRR